MTESLIFSFSCGFGVNHLRLTQMNDTNVSTNEDKKYTGRLLYPMDGHSTHMRNAQNVALKLGVICFQEVPNLLGPFS